ncbi:MAG: ATP-grasp domain-containing protein [Caulobacteraceae bacterium]|nr:ATP-grasp domain-containing protein [Caulobacteraceae bacterium]
MFDSLLIANRGEIARRIIRTARRLGLSTVAVYSEADAGAAHVQEADQAVLIGPPPAAASYLRVDAILEAARSTGAQAVHPGYGFLSENAGFARAVIEAGLAWIGPAPQIIAAVGDKAAARTLMAAKGLPVNPGGEVADAAAAATLAGEIGFPLMVKAAAGGGGIGMKVVRNLDEIRATCERTREQALRFFGDGGLLVERYLEDARHVEVQILGLADGRVLAPGERDCSVQRRFQKVVEETPSPGVSPGLRARMLQTCAAAAERLGYRGAGTVECLVKGDAFVFLEVNARLQVEHPVTELVTGLDLVEAQLRVAAGEAWTPPEGPAPGGHAIELRVYAEDPVRFLPGPGPISVWREPVGEGVRVDAGYRAGDVVSAFYDPLMAKLCVWGSDRAEALSRARRAVAEFEIEGPKSNLAFLAEVLEHPDFVSGAYDTGLVARMRR